MPNTNPLRDFLELSYKELEKMNREARALTDPNEAKAKHCAYLEGEPRVKAITVCFSDIEGRLHTLDYDKRFFLDSHDNFTFDGSSIKGLSEQHDSDLRLSIDWTSLTYLPADVFGPGKVIIFGNVCNRDMQPYASDFRGQLQAYTVELKTKRGITARMAPEIEGFLLKGVDAEQNYNSLEGFDLVSTGGYYHSLPLDELHRFIDTTAEAQRAMGFKNEKDHPEVAPSQFEINFSHADVLRACDQAQLYKLVCRQIAMSMGLTASFLPKPLPGINGSGMHINLSIQKNGKNLFYDPKGEHGLSPQGWTFIDRLLNRAPDLCLIFNSSVNAYRRLDPHFEAPNQIKASANDRGSMIRIPYGNEKSARIEIRSVGPDVNPYLAILAMLKTGLDDGAPKASDSDKRSRLRYLPDTIHDAIRLFKASDYTTSLLGDSGKSKYLAAKETVAARSPRELGTRIKSGEVIYHHEVTNQYLWSRF